MKLRSLTLHNVRRFADQTASIGPFGDGLTTITAENEQGKSTFFDALHVVLFSTHTSKTQEIRSLRPHSGGPVQIAVEIALENRLYRIEKTFLEQTSARVIDGTTGAILHQAGDAEAWIGTYILRAHKGPSGLLWVRQGMVHVDPEGRDKDADNRAARRDLMSSVQGQIDAVTGGRRMDRIMGRAQEALDVLATKTLRAKAGGPWKEAEDAAEALSATRDDLLAKVRKLSAALAEKRAAKARLKTLSEPEYTETRAAKITTAAKALEAAQGHAAAVERAAAARDLIGREEALVKGMLAEIEARRTRRAALIAESEAQTKAQTIAQSTEFEAAKALAAQKARVAKASEARQNLEAERQAARTAQATAQKWDQLRALHTTRQALAAPRVALQDAQVLLDAAPRLTSEDVDALDKLQMKLTVAETQHAAQAARATLHPKDGAQSTLDGTRLPPETEIVIDRELTLSLEGYGAVRLLPGTTTDHASLETLRTTLSDRLIAFGVADVPAARGALNMRTSAQAAAATARAQIDALAPDGVEALEAKWRALCGALAHPQDTPPPPAAPQETTARLDTLDAQAQALDLELEAARAPIDTLQEALNKALTARAEATATLARVHADQDAHTPSEDEKNEHARLTEQRAALAVSMAQAEAELSTLQAEAPDVATLEAAHRRLVEAQAADKKERQELDLRLAHLGGEIQAQADDAIEEKLAETEGQLSQTQERAARFAREAQAWALLIEHLEAARQAAQETYFAPIRAELTPLLTQLYAGAAFDLDPDKMLVRSITRDGVTDPVDVLSGGAYEQIAILTRLAFARLFAKQGKHLPIILDDALVHTDDARIEAMFTMLTQTAQDQQIIVLSCRTRAFSELGGTRATIRVTAD